MKNIKLDFQAIPQELLTGLSKFDIQYIFHPEQMENIIGVSGYRKQLIRALEARKGFSGRTQIKEILTAQYQHQAPTPAIQRNIEKLSLDNTFTVICAHQPCLLGGPLYWVYKILSTIAYCHHLKIEFPEFEFVPVYFSGNEDHDFDEINHLHLFHKKIEWNETAGPAVGRLPVPNLKSVLQELKELFKSNPFAQQFLDEELLEVEKATHYSDYFRHFTDKLFGTFGLIHFNPDDPEAKKLLIPILVKELTEEFIFSTCKKSSDQLLQSGFNLQVNPRAINLFYHDTDGRKRIIKTETNDFSLVDSTKNWTQAEILDEVHQYPENFSPNVLIRPIYQELLFPNVAFVGGAAEINYWMQLYSSFESIQLPFPALIRRHSLWFIDKHLSQKIHKSGFSKQDFFKSKHDLESILLSRHENQSPVPVGAFQNIHDDLNQIRLHISELDVSTQSSISAEIQKIIKSVEHIEQKIRKYQKGRFDVELQHIHKIKDALFPDGIPQERHFNFLPNYFEFGESYFVELLERFKMHTRELLFAEEKEL